MYSGMTFSAAPEFTVISMNSELLTLFTWFGTFRSMLLSSTFDFFGHRFEPNWLRIEPNWLWISSYFCRVSLTSLRWGGPHRHSASAVRPTLTLRGSIGIPPVVTSSRWDGP